MILNILIGTMKLILQNLIVVFLFLSPAATNAAFCKFLPPKDSREAGSDHEFGLIMIPGSKIPGEQYKPLGGQIQSIFPGKLWIGVTEGWLIDMPNPFEVETAISGCLEIARYIAYVINP
jgi:hypothetical protein